MRIGIFGGSFSPVHVGHLKLAEAAYSELNLDRVYFVPSNRTPLKSQDQLLPVELRLKLLRIALKNRPFFRISTCEIRRGGASYTVDTLRFFKKKFGKKNVLYFLSGADNLRNLSRWKSVDDVLNICRFVVMTRPGYQARRFSGPVLFLPFDAIDVSASGIRRALGSGREAEGLVPAGTYSILKKHYSKAA